MILWKSKNNPWPTDHPGYEYFTHWFKQIELATDWEPAIVHLAYSENSIRPDGSTRSLLNNCTIAVMKKFKLGYKVYQYDGYWKALNLGFFQIDWYSLCP